MGIRNDESLEWAISSPNRKLLFGPFNRRLKLRGCVRSSRTRFGLCQPFSVHVKVPRPRQRPSALTLLLSIHCVLACCLHRHVLTCDSVLPLMSQEPMRAFPSAIFEWIFGCHHRHLSRVLTIDHKTYQVCFDCGRKLLYSWSEMAPINSETPQTLASFKTAFTQAMNNFWAVDDGWGGMAHEELPQSPPKIV